MLRALRAVNASAPSDTRAEAAGLQDRPATQDHTLGVAFSPTDDYSYPTGVAVGEDRPGRFTRLRRRFRRRPRTPDSTIPAALSAEDVAHLESLAALGSDANSAGGHPSTAAAEAVPPQQTRQQRRSTPPPLWRPRARARWLARRNKAALFPAHKGLLVVTEEQYDTAAKLAASGANAGLRALSQDKRLLLYGWFKQVAEGNNTAAAPGMLSAPGSKLKWEAWAACKGMSKEAAMKAYVDAINEWKSKG